MHLTLTGQPYVGYGCTLGSEAQLVNSIRVRLGKRALEPKKIWADGLDLLWFSIVSSINGLTA